MSELLEKYGHKRSGELLSSETWNGLVGMIAEMTVAITNRIETLDSAIKAVNESVATMSQKVGKVDAKTDETREQVVYLYNANYRLTLRTTGARYAVGSPATMVARITDLRGDALPLAEESKRPWVDFITTWGKFSPASGYEAKSRGDAGDRSMSVQVDASGTAQVQLTAEQIDDLPAEHQIQLSQVLLSRAAGQTKTLAEHILEARTPDEVKGAGVFKTLSDHYDNNLAAVRNFADSYYLRNAVKLSSRARLPQAQLWKDYLSTVFAFVKNDLDPATADSARGAASSQVVFRDWVSPWIHSGFLADIAAHTQSFRDRIVSKIGADSQASSRLIKNEVAAFVKDTGVLGRQRNFSAMRTVFNSFTVPNAPAYVPAFALSMRDAVGLQQSLDLTSAAVSGDSGAPLVFETFTGSSVDAYAAADTVKQALQQQIAAVEQKVNDVKSKADRVDGDMSAVKGRVDKHDGQFTEMTNLHAKVSTVQNQVSALQNFKVLDVPIDIDAMKKDILEIRKKVGP